MQDSLYRQSLEDVLNRVCLFLGYIIIPTSIGSVYRFVTTGWLPAYTLHLLLPAVIISLSYFRRAIPFTVKAVALLLLGYIMVVVSFIQFSLASFVIGYLFLMVLMARIFLGATAAWLGFGISMVTILVSAYLTIEGIIEPKIDTTSFHYQWSAWVNIFVSFVLVMAMIVMVASSIGDILIGKSLELADKNAKLLEAIWEIRKLRATIPICSRCNQVRDDEGFWRNVEEFLRSNKNMTLTHSFCQSCTNKLYPDFTRQDSADAE